MDLFYKRKGFSVKKVGVTIIKRWSLFNLWVYVSCIKQCPSFYLPWSLMAWDQARQGKSLYHAAKPQLQLSFLLLGVECCSNFVWTTVFSLHLESYTPFCLQLSPFEPYEFWKGCSDWTDSLATKHYNLLKFKVTLQRLTSNLYFEKMVRNWK